MTGSSGKDRLLSPPVLQRTHSSASTGSNRSVHSQQAHRSHFSLDDPSGSIVSNTMAPTNPHAHHIHAQHGNIFVPIHGGNTMPDFDSLAVAEQRELIQDEVEDAEAAANERTRLIGDRGQRRKSVAFGSDPEPPVYGGVDGYVDPAIDNQQEEEVDTGLHWRKASLPWLIPVVTCFALCMGMGSAPKQELMINLACLSHPPQTQTAGLHLVEDVNMSVMHLVKAVWDAPSVSRNEMSFIYESQRESRQDHLVLGGFVDLAVNLTEAPALPPLTPADKWMIELQKRIAEDRARQEEARRRPISGGKDPRPQDGNGLPVGEVPHRPVGGSGGSDGENSSEGDGSKSGNDGRTGGSRDAPRPPIDPRLCKKSPKTQAAAATLTMTMTLSMGILSALTTGFWGAVSDRLGRTKVMSIAVLGLVVSDVVLIITAAYPHKVPGGYRFILLGPIIDGLLGGFSTIMATNNAYLSDVTPDGSRAKSFGRVQGIMMFGFSLGPILGSALIRATEDIMSVFYLAAAFNTCLVFFIAFVLPESLTHEARHALGQAVSAKRLAMAEREAAERAWEDQSENEADETDVNASGWSRISGATAKSSRSKKRFHGRMKRLRRRMFAFLSPLRLFIPKTKVVEEGGRVSVKKDYNLLLLVMAMACITSIMALMQVKAQFLMYRYSWSSAELGPYLTLMAGTRGFVLLIFMPLMIRIFKPIVKPDPSRPHLDVAAMQAIADTRFDLTVVRTSLLVEMLGYGAMSVLVPAPVFVLLTCFVTFGSCTSPASNSLALSLIDSTREAGKLFGGLSVVSAMSTTFIGPLAFSLVFAHTVGRYAPAVFAVAAGIVLVAQVILAFMDLPRAPHVDDDERGRARGVKRVESSSTAGSSRGSL